MGSRLGLLQETAHELTRWFCAHGPRYHRDEPFYIGTWTSPSPPVFQESIIRV